MKKKKKERGGKERRKRETRGGEEALGRPGGKSVTGSEYSAWDGGSDEEERERWMKEGAARERSQATVCMAFIRHE